MKKLVWRIVDMPTLDVNLDSINLSNLKEEDKKILKKFLDKNKYEHNFNWEVDTIDYSKLWHTNEIRLKKIAENTDWIIEYQFDFRILNKTVSDLQFLVSL